MSEQDYDSKIEIINAIKDKNIKTPNMPVEIFLLEAEYLYQWCRDDKDDLIKAGLDWSIVNDLPIRAGALREAESIWFNEWFNQQEAQKIWNDKSLLAYDLRNEILHIMQFAYRKDIGLSQKATEIYEGNSHVDIIQDLNNVSILGKENSAPLKAVGMDLDLLDQAAAMAGEMTELLGRATVGEGDKSPACIIRNKAYTYLKEAVDEIRDYGQYIFWKNENRLTGYRSSYFRRHQSKAMEILEEEIRIEGEY